MEESIILHKLRELRARLLFTEGWKVICFCLFAGIAIGAAFLLFIKVTGLFYGYYNYFILPVILSVFAGLILIALQKVSLMEVALKSDGRLHLKERLSTALEWLDQNKMRTPMFRALIRDTAHAAKTISTREVFPLEWKPQFKKLFGITTLMVVFIYMPTFSLFVPKIDPVTVKTIKEEAKKIEKLSKKLENTKPRTPASLKNFKRVEKSLNKLSSDLKKPDINKRQALSKISRVREELSEYLSKKEALSRMEKQLRRANLSGKSEGDEEEEKEFNELSRKLQEISAKLKDKEKLNEEEKKELIKQLEKMKEEMEKAGMDTNEIEKALDNLKQGKNKEASKNIKNVSDQFQQKQNEMEDLQDLEETADKLDESSKNISGWQDSNEMKDLPISEFKKGKGQAPADFGKGSTNEEKKNEAEPSNKYTKRLNDERRTTKEIFRKMYKPERDEFKTSTDKVKGKLSKGPTIRSLRTRQRGAPRLGDTAKTEAGDTYANYKTKGEEAVKRQRIPAKYKELIREYYDNIDPEK